MSFLVTKTDIGIMTIIRACECLPPNFPPPDPIDAPDFENVQEFENWLREVHIPRTLIESRIPLSISIDGFDEIDSNKIECWGIFSSNGEFERCCLVYPKTHLERFPEFENYLKGKIFSHNHFSSDSTLSIGEVLLWANLKMKEFRAVTEHCTYLIKPINQNWPNPDLLLNEIKVIFPSFDFDPSITNNNELRHICYQILARDGYFVYEY